MTGASLFVGDVAHQRLRPKFHKLNYKIFWLCLPLGESDAPRTRLLSRERFNLFSFYQKDYGPAGEGPLLDRIQRLLTRHAKPKAARILCFSMPRILGYVFNPITLFLCRDTEGKLTTVIYEVTNTFRERHHYVLDVTPGTEGHVQQACRKALYVSPFLDMNLSYRFFLKALDERLFLAIQDRDAEGVILSATFAAERQPLGDAKLLSLFLSLPVMTLKVMVGIHWEALKLWWKGVPVHAHHPVAQTKVLAKRES